MAPWLLLPWILLFFDTLRRHKEDGSEGVAALWSGFCARSVLSCRKLVSFRTLAFFFPLVTGTFSSFNATHSLSILDHCSCFNSPVRGDKISQSKFLISSPLRRCPHFLIIRHRHLLMNLHVVQFQFCFELRDSLILNLNRLSWISSCVDSRTSSHLVSNSEYYRHTENKSA